MACPASVPRPRPTGFAALRRSAGAVCLAAGLAGCAPSMDWREVRADQGNLVALFPCKPVLQSRAPELDGRTWSAELRACDAGGVTFALLTARSPQVVPTAAPAAPAAVLPATDSLLRVWADAAARRWGEPLALSAPPKLALPADTPIQWRLLQRPGTGDRAVRTQALFFQQDDLVVQASVSAPAVSDEAIETFFGALKLHTQPRSSPDPAAQ